MTALADLIARIERLDSLVPEQVASTDSDETDGALLDQWGRKHALRATTLVGRAPIDGLALRQASVSLKHATLTYDDDADRWYATDVGSKNGTYLNGAALAAAVPHRLVDHDLIVFGDIAFVFVADRHGIPDGTVGFPASATVDTKQRRIQLVLHKPTIEGAGVATFGDETVTLGSTQFALLTLLAERYLETKADSPETRGFVRSIELLANLPWNTAHPEDNHVKQQIRRVRRAFERIGIPDVIESKHGFGYRLRLPPVIER